MKTLKYTYWQDGDHFIGHLNDFPDYETQALSKDELVNNLKSILVDIDGGEVPYIKHTDELVVA
jgi:hypothetical protein